MTYIHSLSFETGITVFIRVVRGDTVVHSWHPEASICILLPFHTGDTIAAASEYLAHVRPELFTWWKRWWHTPIHCRLDITSVWLVSVTFVQRMRRQGVCAFHESVFCISEVVVYSTVSCKLEKVQNWQDIMRWCVCRRGPFGKTYFSCLCRSSSLTTVWVFKSSLKTSTSNLHVLLELMLFLMMARQPHMEKK